MELQEYLAINNILLLFFFYFTYYVNKYII